MHGQVVADSLRILWLLDLTSLARGNEQAISVAYHFLGVLLSWEMLGRCGLRLTMSFLILFVYVPFQLLFFHAVYIPLGVGTMRVVDVHFHQFLLHRTHIMIYQSDCHI